MTLYVSTKVFAYLYKDKIVCCIINKNSIQFKYYKGLINYTLKLNISKVSRLKTV